MKKVMNKIMLTLSFAIAFIFAAALPVGAAETFETINNVKVTGTKDGTVVPLVLEGNGLRPETLYVVPNSETEISLKYISNNKDQYPYISHISILKCAYVSDVPNAPKSCAKHDLAIGEDQINALRAGGYKFKLSQFATRTESVADGAIVNGTAISTLDSAYGLKNVTYVIIDYIAESTYRNWLFQLKTNTEAQYTEVIKFLDLDAIGGGAITVGRTVSGQNMTINVDASFDLTKISYFAAADDIDLATITDATKFAEVATANSATISEATVTNNPSSVNTAERKGLLYRTEFTVSVEEGKAYYVMAEDKMGNVTLAKIAHDAAPENNGGNTSQSKVPDITIDGTTVGRIILVILVGVLVLAAVLVIVQKIVDHKRRLY